MGELHLDVLVDRMRREFKVEANVGAPQILTAKHSVLLRKPKVNLYVSLVVKVKTRSRMDRIYTKRRR